MFPSYFILFLIQSSLNFDIKLSMFKNVLKFLITTIGDLIQSVAIFDNLILLRFY